ncbi:RagB/SusD family nutrient uptake outer membrane protein [Chitinophaga qingshengii]|uniref:RagB/SusD family nutrient uptake outer membrane protein n=1 Tax=Chitinophaga qingshengii TaxID=1569794 RepID=A0ABR7TKW0_9BACT|nr:RagB/SusD family nutrient uptake outer membrane protein [Chitinophaga qingshengii]MBC9930588.1 RagB/SusD family nutrient uptake outer membrane protein [Chitinophaga qingshengii]
MPVIAGITLLTGTVSCRKGLDYDNQNNLNPNNVWKDSTMIGAFLSDIYGNMMPGWTFNGADSDEGISNARSMPDYSRGILAISTTNSKLDYTNIDKINFFLDKLQTLSSDILSDAKKQQFTGEAKFWRAWAYWGMVKNLGGVPLILHTQPADNVDALFVPRNKTSECIAQIVKDLDDAIQLLPGVYANAGKDYGRITKVAAMAFKGRVLLSYASPLFNPTGNAARWQAAYDANKAAVDFAVTQGHGLFPSYRNIWYQERNPEVIMVNQFQYPNNPTYFNYIRPEPMTKDVSNNNQPLLSLLLAFPKRDGAPMLLDKARLADPAYNAEFLTDFYTNRDDRFYATIFCGGTPYPAPDEVAPIYVKGNSFWNAWKYDVAAGRYVNILNVIHPGMPGNPGLTGFFDRKGLDTTVTANLGKQAQTDWPEIRFAEVWMNYGECANELGKTAEALQVLRNIRQRAGIQPGINNNYGITAAAVQDIRDAYITERQAEFAFENKRLDDLRRWKRFDILNNQGARHGLYLTLNNNQTVSPSDNIMTAAVRARFTANYIDNLDGDPAFKFNLDLHHWFYAIPPSQISQSKNVLQQNNEWGGAFDPLQ